MTNWILQPLNGTLGADMANLIGTLPNLPQQTFDATHMRYFGADAIKFVFHGTGIITGTMGSEVFVGAGRIQSFDMTLQGNALITATDLNLSAKHLYDLIAGGSGNTTSIAELLLHGADKVTGTALGDTIFGFAGNDTLFGGTGKDQIFSGDGNDRLFGGGAHDVLLGDLGDDSAYGGAANDTLLTGEGNDLLAGGDGADDLDAGNDNDTLYGGAGGDTVFGSFGNDQMFGGDGIDILLGAVGRDRLSGGIGSDLLYGGAGKDQFVFDTALIASNKDQVFDFEVNIDKVVLDDDIFSNLGAPGALAAARFVIGVNAGDASDRIIYNPATGLLSYDRDGRGGAEARVIAQMHTGLMLDAGDFQVIG